MSGQQSKSLTGPEKLIGSRVLDFELVGVIGSGGMSVVYRAEHRVTGQEVAIKILPPELAVHEELKARFVEEARVLARLEHPNIVQLNNFTEAGGRLCLVMQFVEGVTFERRIQEQGRVAPDEAVRVGIEVCKALEYAHGQGVVHRDIKPSNVLLRNDGVVKVTDFGIAKIVGQTRLTSTGQTMGTVRYMSPEQVRGKQADARSDLYSLGVTLWEALAGQTPFDGDSHFAIMQQHLRSRPPPLGKRGVQVPPSLERTLLTALEKSADERFRDARSFRDALEAELTALAPGDGATVATPARPRRVAALLGMVVLLVVGAGASFLAARRWARARPEPAATTTTHAPRTAWPLPHAIAGLALSTDETFASDGLRVQSARARDAVALRDRYRTLVAELGRFLAAHALPAAREAAAHLAPPPLNLVVVPQALLDRADLWPGFHVAADSTYPSRYVEPKRTLFVNDAPGFAERDLPFGIALHALSPSRLSNADYQRLAEEFETHCARK